MLLDALFFIAGLCVFVFLGVGWLLIVKADQRDRAQLRAIEANENRVFDPKFGKHV